MATGGGFQIRAFDATTVKEPGKTGALWRIHWSVCLPSLACDFFKLTRTEGPGSGESLAQFPIRAGDHVLADRGYSTARGIGYVAAAGGQLIVRVNTGALAPRTRRGEPFDLLAAVTSLKRAGAVKGVVRSGGGQRGQRPLGQGPSGARMRPAQVCSGHQAGAAQGAQGGRTQG